MPSVVDDFPACLAAVWQFDGLRDDAAKGEKFATSYGVIQSTWNDAARLKIVTGSIANATIDDCELILRELYWDVCQCPRLPAGVDLLVFNDAMLTGVSHAAGLLQRCVEVHDDGIIGPITLLAVRGIQPEVLIRRLHDADDIYLAALRNAPLFLKGWERREDFMRTTALKMLTPKAIS